MRKEIWSNGIIATFSALYHFYTSGALSRISLQRGKILHLPVSAAPDSGRRTTSASHRRCAFSLDAEHIIDDLFIYLFIVSRRHYIISLDLQYSSVESRRRRDEHGTTSVHRNIRCKNRTHSPSSCPKRNAMPITDPIKISTNINHHWK